MNIQPEDFVSLTKFSGFFYTEFNLVTVSKKNWQYPLALSEGRKLCFLKMVILLILLLGTAAPLDIRITNGIITELAPDLAPQNEEEILDLSGLTVAPGLVDTHVHFRDPGLTYKEDIHTGSLAAAKGGFTSVICMANTKLP